MFEKATTDSQNKYIFNFFKTSRILLVHIVLQYIIQVKI